MKPASTTDTVLTILLWIALIVVGGVGGFFSLFAVMATDRCSPGPANPCNYTTINFAFLVAWGGLALAAAAPSAEPSGQRGDGPPNSSGH